MPPQQPSVARGAITPEVAAEARASIRLRKAKAGDVGLITSSWLKSLRDSTTYHGVDNRTYYDEHHKILAKLLARSAVIVAVLDNDPDHIVAWACYEVYANSVVLHFVYTKYAFRKMGVARMIVEKVLEVEERPGGTGLIVTAKTEKSHHILNDLEAKGEFETRPVYNPWLAWCD
jgi:GNAT superfamily N-acetyltransferase